jgi:hypothetical protein
MKLNFNYYKIIFFILNSLFKLVIILSYFLLICDLKNFKWVVKLYLNLY